jgi:hypothetical protein
MLRCKSKAQPRPRSLPLTLNMLTATTVSADISISVVFGIVGTIINLLGVLVAWWTLRTMRIERCMHSCGSISLIEVSVRSYANQLIIQPGVFLELSRTEHIIGMNTHSTSRHRHIEQLQMVQCHACLTTLP